MKIIVGEDARVGPWICRQLGAKWRPERGATIGLEHPEQGLIAAVLYEEWNGANIIAHIAAVPGKHWLTREFLWFIFYYPFEQLGVRRITGLVAESNLEARRFDENLGFQLEARLKDAALDGDLLVYRMMKEDCRWLRLKKER